MEHANGETQVSRSGSEATHPVFAGTPRAHFVKDANRSTQSSRSGSDAAHPVYAGTTTAIPTLTSTGAQPMQGKRSHSESSELFRQIMFSSSSPTTSITNSGPDIETQASSSSPEATQRVLAGTPPFVGAQPVLQSRVPSPPRPVMPKVYGLPAVRDQNYSLIHILIDSLPATTGKGLVPRQDSNIAFAIPSSEITKYLTLASRHNSELKDQMMNHPVAWSFVDEHRLTYDPFSGIPKPNHLRKRKRNEGEDTPKALAAHEAAAKTEGKAMRHAFVRMADERRRAALEESNLQAKSPNIEELEERRINTRETSDNPYTSDEVPDPHEQPLQGMSADLQDQIQQEQVPETPRARGWGLSSFLPSVSLFIPFSSRRPPSAAGAPPHVTPNPQELARIPTINEPRPIRDLAARHQPSDSRRGAETEPRQRNNRISSQNDVQGLATYSAFAQRIHREKPQRILLTKKQAEERRKLKQEKEQLRADKKRLIQEEARIAQEKKDWEEERTRAAAAQTPGTKRKRVPSPETYPLPARGYGLVDAIFDYSSDEESSEDEQETPTRPRPNKKARVSSSSMDINGDPVASQYEGGSFAGAGASSEGAYSNVFGRRATIDAEATTTTPPGPFKNKFTVPSPTDSEPDEEKVDEESANATSGELSMGTQATASTSLPSQQAQSYQAAITSPSKSMPPPPTPNPSHATLPIPPTWASVDPVEKAREKALKHQPKYGSRLRESSRLSSSTVESDSGIQPLEDHTQFDESQYDPRRPAMLPHTSPLDQAKSAFAEYQAQIAKDSTTTVRHRHAPWDGKGFSYDNYCETMTPGVEAHIEVTWDEDGDDVLIGLGDRRFEADYEAWKQKQDSEEAIRGGAKDSSIANESDQLSYEKADIDARVRTLIDGNVTEEDEEMAGNDFDEGYEAWRAMEMQKQGALIPIITA